MRFFNTEIDGSGWALVFWIFSRFFQGFSKPPRASEGFLKPVEPLQELFKLLGSLLETSPDPGDLFTA